MPFGETSGRTRRQVIGVILALTVSGIVSAGGVLDDGNWPQFRGPNNQGVADGQPLPERWDVAAGKGVLWKTVVPGLGLSAPVIWGDRIFITTAIGGADESLKVGLYGDIVSVDDQTKHRFQVLAIDKRTGKVLWTQTAYEGVPKIKRHTKSSHANPSVATDGRHVIASFGSEGLYAYDMQGKLLWKKDLGLLDSGFFQVPDAQWGFGSSPVLHEGMVIVQADVQKGSFLAAYDVKSGKQVWKTSRADVPTWGTPTVHVGKERSQVLVNGWKHAGGYDLKTGEELWRMATAGDIPTPTPYVAHDLIFLTNAHGGGIPVYAIKASAKGDISLEEDQTSNEYVVWSDPRGGSYMPTTVVYGDELYVLRDNGVFSCRDAKTGELHYKERVGVGDGFTASLVAGDNKIYVTAETGEIAVVKAGKTFEKLAVNDMGEVCMSAPAISSGQLFFRTRGHLVAIGRAKID